MIRTGNDILEKLKKRIGLPDNVTSISIINIAHDDVVSMRFEFLPDLSDDDVNFIVDMIGQEDACKGQK